jgi:hypothetical protein
MLRSKSVVAVPDEAVVPVDEPKTVERLKDKAMMCTSKAMLRTQWRKGWPDEQASPHRSKARRD